MKLPCQNEFPCTCCITLPMCKQRYIKTRELESIVSCYVESRCAILEKCEIIRYWFSIPSSVDEFSWRCGQFHLFFEKGTKYEQ